MAVTRKSSYEQYWTNPDVRRWIKENQQISEKIFEGYRHVVLKKNDNTMGIKKVL